MERLVLGEIGTNCYIVPFDGKAIVIDPGDNAALIIRRLADLNLAPSHFLLTHGHFDHLAALPALFRGGTPIKRAAIKKPRRLPCGAVHCAVTG